MGGKRNHIASFWTQCPEVENVSVRMLRSRKRRGEWRKRHDRGNENIKACHRVAGGTFKPCWKCDYLFNHTSGKVSRGTGVEDPCVKKV